MPFISFSCLIMLDSTMLDRSGESWQPLSWSWSLEGKLPLFHCPRNVRVVDVKESINVILYISRMKEKTVWSSWDTEKIFDEIQHSFMIKRQTRNRKELPQSETGGLWKTRAITSLFVFLLTLAHSGLFPLISVFFCVFVLGF